MANINEDRLPLINENANCSNVENPQIAEGTPLISNQRKPFGYQSISSSCEDSTSSQTSKSKLPLNVKRFVTLKWNQAENANTRPIPSELESNSNLNKKVNSYSSLTAHVGGFGKFQKLLSLLLGLPVMITTMHVFSWTFIGWNVKHHCLYPGQNRVSPNASMNWYKSLSNITDNHCERIQDVGFGQLPPDNITLEPCVDGYVWDRTVMDYSATERWSMVCNREMLRSIVQSAFYIGHFVGALVLGMLADKCGRKFVFLLSILLQAVTATVMAYVPWWTVFVALRVVVGFCYPGIFAMAVVLGAELVAPKYRVAAISIIELFVATAELALGALAYVLRNYQYLQLAISLPAFLFLTYYWIIPESARWLISTGRFEEAKRILQRVAKFNGKDQLPDIWFNKPDKDYSTDKLSCSERLRVLFGTPNLRKRTLVSCLIWTVSGMCYYGLASNPAFMGGDNRLGFIMGGALAYVAVAIEWLLLNPIGRKLFTSLMFFAAAIFLVAAAVIPSNYSLISIISVLFAKNALYLISGVVYITIPEQYPTSVRNTATGFCGAVSRIGVILSSFLSFYIADKYPLTIVIAYSTLAVISGVATLLLPETTGEQLPETVEEAEKLGMDQPIFITGYQNVRLVARRNHVAETSLIK